LKSFPVSRINRVPIINISYFTEKSKTVDIPEYNLWRGQVGTVVELLADGAAFEVEFSDRNGRTYESVGLQKRANHGVVL
jgi:Domain of unknown function (DUF4926)